MQGGFGDFWGVTKNTRVTHLFEGDAKILLKNEEHGHMRSCALTRLVRPRLYGFVDDGMWLIRKSVSNFWG